MSGGHGHEDHGGHGGGGGGSNAMGECLFGFCKETSSAARGITDMIYGTFLGIFGGGGGGGGGGHDSHGHH